VLRGGINQPAAVEEFIMSTTTITPFTSDAEFLDAAIAALHSRCRRIVAEHALRDAQQGVTGDDIDEAQQRAATTAQREKEVKDALDARLAAHREHGSFVLGMDRLTHEADLGEDERLILICCFTAAISEDTAAQVFDGLDFALYVSMTVEGLCRVLEAGGVAERLRVRRMLDTEAPLMKHGLVQFTGRVDADIPEELNGTNVKLTRKAFDVLVGCNAEVEA
jgi:hypothetical protein